MRTPSVYPLFIVLFSCVSISSLAMGNEQKKKIVIDTDAGVDDAQAILMALNASNIDVIAITTVQGNTNALQAGKNVLRVLKLADRLDVPVYVGCNHSILGNQVGVSIYHGADGFGETIDFDPPDYNLIKEESGAEMLIRLSKKHEGELILLAIGPLTNLATALKIDPTFGSRLLECFVMGGNYYGKGNITTSAEFNFYTDPEAAYITLEQLNCKLTIIGWEVCEENGCPWSTYDELRSIQCKTNTFLKKIEAFSKKYLFEQNWSTFLPADEFCMAAILKPDDVILESKCVYATIELQGKHTYGQMIVDWCGVLKKEANVHIVTKINQQAVLEALKRITQMK